MKQQSLYQTMMLLITLVWMGSTTLFAQNVGDKFQHTDGLYYRITSLDPATVETAPQNDDWPFWNEDDKPTGTLVIPEQITHNNISYSVTAIGKGAFSECSGLTGDLTIPSSIISIKANAFYKCIGFTGNLTIGNNVENIGKSSFSHCSSFTGDLIIPNSVIWIGNSAFDDCGGFNGELVLGNKLIDINESAFHGCTGFTGNLIIPNSVMWVGDFAFGYCSGFNGNLIIGNNVESIGAYAFAHCKGFIGDLTISDNLIFIGYLTFSYCRGLTSFVVSNENSNYSSKDGVLFNKPKTELIAYPINNPRTSYVIPNSVNDIEWEAFSGCNNLMEITIPNNVTSIGDGAFTNCNGVVSFIVENNNINYCSEDGVLFNKDKTSLIRYPVSNPRTFYSIPKSIRYIESHSFRSCKNLTEVIIPKNVKSIASFAFRECTKMISFTVEDGNTYYSSKDGVLYNRNKSVLMKYPVGTPHISYNITNNVNYIQSYAFLKGHNLTEITIPSKIKGIGIEAFSDCNNLKKVTCLAINPNDIGLGENVFEGVPVDEATLYVPTGSVSLYESAEQWKKFKTIKELQDGLDNPEALIHFSLYPNPATDYVSLSFNTKKDEHIRIAMYQLSGRKVYEQDFIAYDKVFNHTFSVKNYAKGTYLIHIKTSKGVITKKIIIK